MNRSPKSPDCWCNSYWRNRYRSFQKHLQLRKDVPEPWHIFSFATVSVWIDSGLPEAHAGFPADRKILRSSYKFLIIFEAPFLTWKFFHPRRIWENWGTSFFRTEPRRIILYRHPNAWSFTLNRFVKGMRTLFRFTED